MSNEDFVVSISRFLKKTENVLEHVIQDTAIEIGARIIKRTPVDTENTVQDWHFSIDSPSEEREERGKGSESAALDELKQRVKEWKPLTGSKKAYITNNKPWAWRLEYGGYPDGPRVMGGYSTQAPEGMVGITVEEFDGIVSDKAKARYT